MASCQDCIVIDTIKSQDTVQMQTDLWLILLNLHLADVIDRKAKGTSNIAQYQSSF